MITEETAKVYAKDVIGPLYNMTEEKDIEPIADFLYQVAQYILTYGELNLTGIPIQDQIQFDGSNTNPPGKVIGMIQDGARPLSDFIK